jgi:hypothetical protein
VTGVEALWCILLFCSLAGLIGHSFIDAYFQRKEELIKMLTDQKGDL